MGALDHRIYLAPAPLHTQTRVIFSSPYDLISLTKFQYSMFDCLNNQTNPENKRTYILRDCLR